MPKKQNTLLPLIAVVLFALITASAPSCKRHNRVAEDTDEGTPQLHSVLSMADPYAAGQAVSGFYAMENGAWRWTKRDFAVALRPPPVSSKSGATLKVKLNIPQNLLEKVGPPTLTASIAGKPVGSQKYTVAGDAEFSADVPAELLSGERVQVDFSLDHFLPAGMVEARELGLVVLRVALESK